MKGHAAKSHKHKAIGDLCVIAFYCLFRVGEYTTKYKSTRTRTKQFRVRDVTLWKDNKQMDKNSPLEQLTQADSATCHIENQKNGVKGQLVHHHATNNDDCPVKATARRLHHILQHTDDHDAIISTYFQDNVQHQVTAAQINRAIKQAVEHAGLLKNGFTTAAVSSHSL